MVFFSLWFVLGHYLLINVTFHYYKGFVTGPGSPKQVSDPLHSKDIAVLCLHVSVSEVKACVGTFVSIM